MKMLLGQFWVTLIAGIIILFIGLFYKYHELAVESSNLNEYGNIQSGTISGNSPIIIGILVLLTSMWIYKSYQKTEKEYLEEE
jgi:high-affinity nickel permease